MRSKKHRNLGFTMMEMLATILVLLVILLIASPSIRKMLSTSNELSKSYIEEITIDAAREYATVVNKDVTKSLKKVDDKEIIPLDVLINLGLIEEEDKEKLGPTASVLLTYQDDSNIKYEIIYDDTVVKNNNPYIILYGSIVYVERGSVYTDPGYKAFDKDGKNITSKVIVTGTVNVSSFGMYQLTYNVTDDDNVAGDTKTRTVMVVDGTYPSATTIIATSNNPYDNKLAKNGETVTVNITFNKEVTNPTVTIGGRPATVTGSGATRTATYTIPPSESTLVNKAIEIKVSSYKDLYDNNGEIKTGVTTGGAVVFDNIKPVILSSTITSNNGNNKLAKNNERLYMETNFSEAIRSVTSTLQGRATSLTGGGTATVTSTYLIPSAESTMTEGNITGLITNYMDRAGNIGISNSIRLVGGTVFYDRTLPTCTVAGGNGTWTNGNRTVTATCNDTGGSGCLANLSKTYTSTINTTTAGAVDNNVGGTVYDNAGNSRACLANQTVRIDKALPSVTAHSPALRNWLNTDISISLSATDTGGSNIASYQYCSTTNGNTCTPATAGATVTLTSTGQYTVCSRAIDGANNIGGTTCSAANAYKIDKTAPTIGINGAGTKTATITCSDTGGSGCDSGTYQYRTGTSTFTCDSTGTWTNYTAPVTLTSNSYVCMRGKDNAENGYSYSSTQLFVVDDTPPTVSVSGAPTNWQNTNASATISCTDASGCDSGTYQYRTGTSTFTCNSTGTWTNYTAAVSIASNTYVCMRAKDVYGNGYAYSSTVQFKVDKTAPTCSVAKSNTGTIDGVTFTVTGSDSGSGIASGTGTFTGIKTSQSYSVTDGVGLTAACTGDQTVTAVTQYHSRTCATHNSCVSDKCTCKTYNSCPNSDCTCKTYNSCPNSDCTCKTYNSCPNSDCTCNTYNSCVSSKCTCATYNTCAACGCATYTYCAHANCGYKKCTSYSCCGTYYGAWTHNSYVCRSSGNYTGELVRYTGCYSVADCIDAGLEYNCKKETRTSEAATCTKSCCGNLSCRTAACGCDAYCASSACSCASYNSCPNSDCSCKTYNSCVSSKCTCAIYNSCVSSKCTCATYNSCVSSKCTCATYNSCANTDCTCATWNAFGSWTTTACSDVGNTVDCASQVIYN